MAVATPEHITIGQSTAVVEISPVVVSELKFEDWAVFMRHVAFGLPLDWSYEESKGNNYPAVATITGLPRTQDAGSQQISAGRRVEVQEIRQRSFSACLLAAKKHALFFFVKDTRLIRESESGRKVLTDTQASKVLVAHRKDSYRISEIILAGSKMVEDPTIPLRVGG
jgi:hypothetical protein